MPAPLDDCSQISLYKSWVCLHHITTLLTGAQFFRTIKIPESRQEVLFNVIEMKPVLVQFVVAFVTIPYESVKHLRVFTLTFDDQSNCSFRSLWTMRSVRRKQKHLAFLYRNIYCLAVFLYPEVDVSFKLIE